MKATLKYLRQNIDGIYSITTKRVADELGISREHYSRIECGYFKLDNLKIKKLAALYKVSKDEIIHAWQNAKGGECNERNTRN